MAFFEILQTLCHSKGITPTEMAKKIGISTAMPTNWKNGQIPNGETLAKLADFLDVSVDYMLGRDKIIKEPTIIPYSGNERVDSIVKLLLNSSIDDNDLYIIEAVLDKYKR